MRKLKLDEKTQTVNRPPTLGALRGVIIPEAFEVKPQDLRQFVDHQLFLCFGQVD